MMRAASTTSVEADLAALRQSAERAGTALACLFSTSDEFEADVIAARRAQRAYETQRSSPWPGIAWTAVLSAVFLML